MNDSKAEWPTSHLCDADGINPRWGREQENIAEYVLELKDGSHILLYFMRKSLFIMISREVINSSFNLALHTSFLNICSGCLCLLGLLLDWKRDMILHGQLQFLQENYQNKTEIRHFSELEAKDKWKLPNFQL